MATHGTTDVNLHVLFITVVIEKPKSTLHQSIPSLLEHKMTNVFYFIQNLKVTSPLFFKRGVWSIFSFYIQVNGCGTGTCLCLLYSSHHYCQDLSSLVCVEVFTHVISVLSLTGTIMATLTRKNKSTEIMPKYEMVTYYRGSTIPNSHIHMYDPDNVNVACSIFRVSFIHS